MKKGLKKKAVFKWGRKNLKIQYVFLLSAPIEDLCGTIINRCSIIVSHLLK